MSARRQKVTIGVVCTVIGTGIGVIGATVRVTLGAKAMAREMMSEIAAKAVEPVADEVRAHAAEAAALRPVMLNWKDEMMEEVRAMRRTQIAICQATPKARCE